MRARAALREIGVCPPFFLLLLIPVFGSAQSVYELEVLPARDFQARENYKWIKGVAIDPKGNVVGVARRDESSESPIAASFYWPSDGGSVRVLAAEGKSPEDCPAVGIDQEGRIYLSCGAVYDPASKLYRRIPGFGTSLYVNSVAGGTWAVGTSLAGNRVTAVRMDPSEKIEGLDPIDRYRVAVALGVNSKGVAVGQVLLPAEARNVGAPSAVAWEPGSSAPKLIEGGDEASWKMMRATAINDGGTIIGTTHLMPISGATCGQSTAIHAFVSMPAADGRRVNTMLPSIEGDQSMNTMVPTGINSGMEIIGYRNGVDCGDATILKGQRAVIWRMEREQWKANALDRLPISLTSQCARDVILKEATAINDSGQITGTGTCADGDNEVLTFAYRLTPIGGNEREPAR